MSEEPKAVTFQPNVYEHVLRILPRDPSLRILDAGAGQGYFSRYLHQHGYKNVEACDLVSENFRASEVPFHEVNLNDSLPFPDNSYDYIVSIEVVEHIEHHANYFREISRVLKHGGTFILTTPNTQSLTSRAFYFVHGHHDAARHPFNPELPSYRTHVNCLGLQALLYYVEHNGLRIARITTNRIRWSAVPLLVFVPLAWLLMAMRFRKKKTRQRADRMRAYMRLAFSKPLLLGRLIILIAQKPA